MLKQRKKYYNMLIRYKQFFKGDEIMNILLKILNNRQLAEKIRLKCDIELYPQLQ